MASTNQNQWFAPQSMSSTGHNQWFSQALRGPPPGFSHRPTYHLKLISLVQVLVHLMSLPKPGIQI